MGKARNVIIDVSQLSISPEAQLKEIENRLVYMYAQTDGTYCIPNSCEGDILKMTLDYIALTKEKEKGIYYGLPLPEGVKVVTLNLNDQKNVGNFDPFKFGHPPGLVEPSNSNESIAKIQEKIEHYYAIVCDKDRTPIEKQDAKEKIRKFQLEQIALSELD